ncbi:MAG TPA: carboxypeptidase regulatory-like domain-containing protein, partial [Gemmatimonadota bacterium]|nr:carboxypeptidase regulatory-like domain-containing protein [Gemmatimonadota bacterium]
MGAVLALLTALPAVLSAQAVRGRMLEAGTGIPVAGALIELRAEGDSAVDRVLTDDGGRFSLRAPAAGSFVLHAERIGFRDWDSESFQVTVGEPVTRIIQVSTQPVSVSALSVQAERKCRLAREQGIATALLWAEVKKGLQATLLSQEGEHYHYVKRDFKRELDEKGRKVRSEEVQTDTTVRARPYVTLSPERLVSDGFVSGHVDAGRTYYAPDVETLLSEPFVDTHCIEVSDDREVDGERWVGLTFKPVDGRSLPDVEGTLWMTANGAQLRAMEFRYVNVEVPVAPRRRKDEGIPGGMMPTTREMSIDGLGGRLSFTRLPSGRWIIRDWTLTLPRVGATRAWWNPNQQFAYVLAGLHQEGGQVLQVRDDASNVLFSHERAALAGFVADSTRGKPLAGAVVSLEGTPYADTTDADGAFRIPDLPEGKYTVSFSHPRLDSLGVQAPERVVQLTEGNVASVDLAVPRPAPQTLASGCPEPAGGASGTANLVGVLRDEITGVPLPFATLTLVRRPGVLGAAAGGKPPSTADVLAQSRADGEGAFRLCGVPAGRGLGLSIRFPGRPLATLRLDLPAGTTVQQDVPV